MKIQINNNWYPCKLNAKEGIDIQIVSPEQFKEFNNWKKKNNPMNLNLKADDGIFVCRDTSLQTLTEKSATIKFDTIRKTTIKIC